MAEPMDLSPAELAHLAEETAETWTTSTPWREGLQQELVETFTAIRDAATAAERQRAIAIVERQPYYPDTHTGMRQQWVKDQILAALRESDHE